jgi:hypothetical protein
MGRAFSTFPKYFVLDWLLMTHEVLYLDSHMVSANKNMEAEDSIWLQEVQ